MRIPVFRRPIQVAGAAVVAAAALVTALIAPSSAAAQTPSDLQPTTGAQLHAPDICIQVYPPPAGCPGRHTPPRQAPDVCIQVYPPPPGCPGSPPPSPPPSWPRSPYPGGAPALRPNPSAGLLTNQPVYRPGEAIVVTFRDSSGALVSNLTDVQCDDLWFEVLGPHGWVPAPLVDPACSAITFAPVGRVGPVAYVPAGQQPGTYRVALRVAALAGGHHIIYGDPFVIR